MRKHPQMKPQRFETGQAVTPKVGAVFIMKRSTSPKQGHIYHVSGYFTDSNYVTSPAIFLREMPCDAVYDERKFDPVDLTTSDIHELYEESISIKETV